MELLNRKLSSHIASPNQKENSVVMSYKSEKSFYKLE